VALPKGELEVIARKGYPAIDDEIISRLKFNESEKILIEDLHQVVLPDAQRRKGTPPGFEPATSRHLHDYAMIFLKVLRATFGKEKHFGATIFESNASNTIPARLIAIHLGAKNTKSVQNQTVQSNELTTLLQRCSELFFRPAEKQIAFQRVIEALDHTDTPEGKVLTLYLVRPNQRRYWLRSLALRDADRLSVLASRLGNVA
jgi:hypothetical protein